MGRARKASCLPSEDARQPKGLKRKNGIVCSDGGRKNRSLLLCQLKGRKNDKLKLIKKKESWKGARRINSTTESVDARARGRSYKRGQRPYSSSHSYWNHASVKDPGEKKKKTKGEEEEKRERYKARFTAGGPNPKRKNSQSRKKLRPIGG